MMRKTLVALMAAVPLLVTGPASAAPPEYLPPAPTEVLPLCGTENGVRIEQVGRSQREHKNGKATGSLRFRLTNLDDGASVLVNASGPGFGGESVDEATGLLTFIFDATGQNLIYPLDAREAEIFAAAGLPEVFVSSGPIGLTGVFNTLTEEVESLTFRRLPTRIRDVCAELT